MLSRSDDSVELWRRPEPRRWLVFALICTLVAFSSVLLAGKEAQAKAKQSPNQDPVERATGGSNKQPRETREPAGNKESRGKEAGNNAAATGSAPRADKSADAGPKLKDKEPVLKETRGPEAGADPEEASRPVAGPVLEKAKSAAEPVLGEAPSTVEPALKEATPAAAPVLEEAAPVTEPVYSEKVIPATAPILETAASTAEPVLEEANRAVEPVLNEAAPVTAPVLDEAASTVEPAASWPFQEATSPTVEPVLEGAISPAEPALEATPPLIEPSIGAAAPVVEPIFETVAPVVGPGFGEEIVREGDELFVPESITNATPAPPLPLSPHDLAVEAWSTLPDTPGSVQDSSRGSTGETRTSRFGLSGARFELFDRSPMFDGSRAALLGPAATMAAEDRMPNPFPFKLPYGTPPLGSSLGGSGPGTGLDLLGLLSLLLILSRVGGLSWSLREAFRLDSSPGLVVERPG